ncbi:hypothetical protein P2318_00630 [Myxococcaceae bacterium GXIMD 01537]
MHGERTFDVPDELDLLEFFGVEPIERAAEDGYWCFVVGDERGVELRFSFNLFERSVQTVVSVGDAAVYTVCHELAERLYVDGPVLRATFAAADATTQLMVRVAPTIRVEWSSLRTR